VNYDNLYDFTFVPPVGAYSRDSGFTSMAVGLCIAFGMSPVSGAPCDVRDLGELNRYLAKIGPFIVFHRETCRQSLSLQELIPSSVARSVQ
jgi:hypothetical protein